MSSSEPIDDGQYGSRRCVLGASDPQFARRRVSEKLDVFKALSQLIENRKAALDDRTPALRRLDPDRTAIKEANPECMFKVADRPRNRRLGSTKALRGLVHAAGLNHGHENAHIMQLDAALNALDFVHPGPPYIEIDIT